jgi:hypothetical protein
MKDLQQAASQRHGFLSGNSNNQSSFTLTELQVGGDVKISGFEMTETFEESVRSVLLPTNRGMKGAIL